VEGFPVPLDEEGQEEPVGQALELLLAGAATSVVAILQPKTVLPLAAEAAAVALRVVVAVAGHLVDEDLNVDQDRQGVEHQGDVHNNSSSSKMLPPRPGTKVMRRMVVTSCS
jgi:hypothetical protein